MARGDHIYVNRHGGIYSHHGIDCGDGTVIHYGSPDWLTRNRVCRASTEEFARSDKIQVRDYSAFFKTLTDGQSGERDIYRLTARQWARLWDSLRGLAIDEIDHSPDAIVARAEQRLGEDNFDVLFNNCEHFASWCVTGISGSDQVFNIWRASLPPAIFIPQFVRSQVTHLIDKFNLKS